MKLGLVAWRGLQRVTEMENKPVAWGAWRKSLSHFHTISDNEGYIRQYYGADPDFDVVPLYKQTSPAAQGLTDERIKETAKNMPHAPFGIGSRVQDAVAFARAILSQAAPAPSASPDGARFRWLTDDLAGDEREARNRLLERMAVMSYSASCDAIDEAMRAEEESK